MLDHSPSWGGIQIAFNRVRPIPIPLTWFRQSKEPVRTVAHSKQRTRSVATQSLDDGTKIHLVRVGQGRINAQVAHRADDHLLTRQCTEDSEEFNRWSIRTSLLKEQAVLCNRWTGNRRIWRSALQIIVFHKLHIKLSHSTVCMQNKSLNLTVCTPKRRIRRSALLICEFNRGDSQSWNLTVCTPNREI